MQTIGLGWAAQGKQIGKFVPLEPIKRIIHEGPYTLTLINVTIPYPVMIHFHM